MAISDQRHASVSKQTLDWMALTLVIQNGANVHVFKSIRYEGMNDISNVRVHLRTHSGNVNLVF